MDTAAASDRVFRIGRACDDLDADASAVEAALVAARELTGWIEARRAALISRLVAVSSFPEATIAEVDRTSLGTASRAKERAETLQATPRLAETLGAGQTTAAHVDAVTRAARRLGHRGSELLDRVDKLAAIAGASTVDQFTRRIDLEAKRLERDNGEGRLERQRRATRMRSWVDGEGMWNVTGRFDPVTGVRLDARIRSAVETLFNDASPEFCPTDPLDKQQFLMAPRGVPLIDGTGGSARPGRMECVVVIDADADPIVAGAGPVAQWPIPVEVPSRVLADLAHDAEVHAIVVRNGVVLHAPERPISTTCCPSARIITARSTTTGGSSNSDPTGNSRSTCPTAPFDRPGHPTEEPPPEAGTRRPIEQVSRRRRRRTASTAGQGAARISSSVAWRSST